MHNELPSNLIVHVLAPGCLEVRIDQDIVGQLKHGALISSSMDIFEGDWLPQRFKNVREEILNSFLSRPRPCDSVTIDPFLFARLSQQMIKRLIAVVQGNRHGGAIFLSSQTSIDAALVHLDIALRQTFKLTQSESRHRALLMQAADMLIKLGSNIRTRTVGWDEYQVLSHQSLNDIDDALFDEAYFIGTLCGADGGVFLNERFEVLGFGAEIFAHDIIVPTVHRALNLTGSETVEEHADSFGTRHRSAFRLIQKHPDTIGIIISQDGDVRFITNKNGKVIYFEHEASLVVELVL